MIAAMLVLVAGCSSGPDPLEAEPVAATSVGVADNVFEPVAIQVPVASEVVWTWEGRNDHNVVGQDFESELVRTGTFRHTFDAPGVYEYVCTIHPAMRGVVRVEAS